MEGNGEKVKVLLWIKKNVALIVTSWKDSDYDMERYIVWKKKSKGRKTHYAIYITVDKTIFIKHDHFSQLTEGTARKMEQRKVHYKKAFYDTTSNNNKCGANSMSVAEAR